MVNENLENYFKKIKFNPKSETTLSKIYCAYMEYAESQKKLQYLKKRFLAI